ncbi:hypothetical protein B1U23_04830 (plasmid) [Borreliella burgdorferi]|nr:hypothetical protein B1U23_04830 [Borreliella burgdorferi]ARS32006.1 hypothetical protein B1U22_05190 [Borreliella burgdorferi]ARS32468.1 hypothetical protein B1U21_00945 [Borreliella burgdorferi]PNL89956.1 hypothetical protein A6J35_000650 [Borreliella burgdorferi]PRQ91916.1 hypothetical protein CV690_06300 [Borreliella burgdorferi]
MKDFPSFFSLYLYKNKYIAKTIFANFFTKIFTKRCGLSYVLLLKNLAKPISFFLVNSNIR